MEWNSGASLCLKGRCLSFSSSWSEEPVEWSRGWKDRSGFFWGNEGVVLFWWRKSWVQRQCFDLLLCLHSDHVRWSLDMNPDWKNEIFEHKSLKSTSSVCWLSSSLEIKLHYPRAAPCRVAFFSKMNGIRGYICLESRSMYNLRFPSMIINFHL